MILFSQSALQSYSRCPQQYQLRYLLRQPWPAPEQSPALEYERQRRNGEAFHRLVHQALLGLPTAKLEARANALGDPLPRWWQAFLQAQADLLQAAGSPALQPERTFSLPLPDGRLVAKFDLLHATPTGWTIYDWKTGLRLPARPALAQHWQTRVYLALATRVSGLAPEQIRMIYWYANAPETQIAFAYTQSDFQRDWEAILQLTHEMATASAYPRTQDERLCAWCNYRSYCDRGQQAGDWQQALLPEEAAPPSETLDFDQIAEVAF